MLSVFIARSNVFFVMPSNPAGITFRRVAPKIKKKLKQRNIFLKKQTNKHTLLKDHGESKVKRETTSSQKYMQISPAGNRTPVSRVTPLYYRGIG